MTALFSRNLNIYCCGVTWAIVVVLGSSVSHAFTTTVTSRWAPLTTAATASCRVKSLKTTTTTAVFQSAGEKPPSSSSLSSTTITRATSSSKQPLNGGSEPYLATYNETIAFPSFDQLMELGVGGYVTSPKFTITAAVSPDGTTASTAKQEYDFCVKLYPRGGGHKSQHSMMENIKNNNDNDKSQVEADFGMSYAVPSPFGNNGPHDEKVGVYLQFLPRSPTDTVDANFSLRIKGQQRLQRKFDVEWRSGMRFVTLENSKLARGLANDFGAHLMQTRVLDSFLGIMENDESLTAQENKVLNAQIRSKPVQLEVEVVLHAPLQHFANDILTSDSTAITNTTQQEGGVLSGGVGLLLESGGFGRLLQFNDLRQEVVSIATVDNQEITSTSNNNNIAEKEPLRVGKIVVPVLRKLSQRPRMFEMGIYPGVEYRLLRIIDTQKNRDLFYTRPGADYELKPIYPLVQQLERPWPVRVNEGDIPKLITPTQYNLISAIGSLFAAGSALVTAFILSQAVSLFFIPSKSMEPTLQIGDVLLVDKLTPRLFPNNKKVGDVVLFHPPELLQELVKRNSGGRRTISDRDLFVKRIAALPGDVIQVVDKSGAVRINGIKPLEQRNLCTAEPLRLIEQYMDPENRGQIKIEPGQVGVLGDCSSVSVDSRVWGALPQQEIIGRPIVRLWPLSRFGSIDSLPKTITNDWSE